MAPGLAPYLAAVIGINPMPPFVASSDMPKIKGPLIPRPTRHGGSGTGNSFGTITDCDVNTELRGAQWYGSNGQPGIAQQMQRNSYCRQNIRYVADPLGSAIWRFETKGTRPVDVEAARFCEWAFLEQSFWPRYRESAISNYYSCGFDLHELTDDLRPVPAGRFPLHPGGGRGLVPIGLHEIPCNTVSYFHQSNSDPNKLDHVTQWQPYSGSEECGWRDIPADRIVRLTWGQEGSNFAGFSPYRSIYGPWKLLIAFTTYEAILHDRCAVPVPTSVQSENAEPEDIEAVDTILAEMRSHQKGYINLPFGYSFSWLQASCDDAENLRESIIRLQVEIAMGGSAGFMMLGANLKNASYSLASTQQGQYHLTTRTHAEFLASGLNESPDGWSPVGRIVAANYGPDVAIPKLVARNLPTHPWDETAKVAINAITAKAIRKDARTEAMIREWIQLEPFDESTEIKDAIATAPFVGKPANLDPTKTDDPPDGGMEPGNDNEPDDEREDSPNE